MLTGETEKERTPLQYKLNIVFHGVSSDQFPPIEINVNQSSIFSYAVGSKRDQSSNLGHPRTKGNNKGKKEQFQNKRMNAIDNAENDTSSISCAPVPRGNRGKRSRNYKQQQGIQSSISHHSVGSKRNKSSDPMKRTNLKETKAHLPKKIIIVLDNEESDEFPPIEMKEDKSRIFGHSVGRKRDHSSVSGDTMMKGKKKENMENADELENEILQKGKCHRKLTWGPDQYFRIPKRHKIQRVRDKKTQSITYPARKNSGMTTQKTTNQLTEIFFKETSFETSMEASTKRRSTKEPSDKQTVKVTHLTLPFMSPAILTDTKGKCSGLNPLIENSTNDEDQDELKPAAKPSVTLTTKRKLSKQTTKKRVVHPKGKSKSKSKRYLYIKPLVPVAVLPILFEDNNEETGIAASPPNSKPLLQDTPDPKQQIGIAPSSPNSEVVVQDTPDPKQKIGITQSPPKSKVVLKDPPPEPKQKKMKSVFIKPADHVKYQNTVFGVHHHLCSNWELAVVTPTNPNPVKNEQMITLSNRHPIKDYSQVILHRVYNKAKDSYELPKYHNKALRVKNYNMEKAALSEKGKVKLFKTHFRSASLIINQKMNQLGKRLQENSSKNEEDKLREDNLKHFGKEDFKQHKARDEVITAVSPQSIQASKARTMAKAKTKPATAVKINKKTAAKTKIKAKTAATGAVKTRTKKIQNNSSKNKNIKKKSCNIKSKLSGS